MTLQPIKVISKLDPKIFEDFKSAIISLVDRVYKRSGWQSQIPLQTNPNMKTRDNLKLDELPSYSQPRIGFWSAVGWLNITDPTQQLTDECYNTIWEEVRGTVIEEVLNSLPVKVCRSRIMVLDEEKGAYKYGYPLHTDSIGRFHIPILTNTKCGFLFPEQQFMKRLEADGTVYWADTKLRHTYVNWGGIRRIHVMCSTADRTWSPNF